MRLAIDVHLHYRLPQPHDVLLQVEAAAMADQRLIEHDLRVTSSEPLRAVPGEEAIGQRTWAWADGDFCVDYKALVEITRPALELAALRATNPRDLPALVVPYLLPSRYCEADKLEAYTLKRFAEWQGGAKVQAIRDWVARELAYTPGASDGKTTAADTFAQRMGVCRDYAHLTAALCRAAMIPARVVSGYAPRVDPPDFHALVEVWLEDGWHLIDATGMSEPGEVARIAVGRDATDIAFMTIFGTAQLVEQRVGVTQME